MRITAIFATSLILEGSAAFTIHTSSTNRNSHFININAAKTHNDHRKSATTLNALTPVGPFCPFRSSAAIDVEPRMEKLSTETQKDFATEMARLQLDMTVGKMPDPDRLRTVASGIEAAVDDWENLLARLNLSNDFQTREYAKLTQAHLKKHGQSSEEIAIMMRWQAKCMVAMAENRPPPFPPPEIDVMKLMNEAKKNEEAGGVGEGGQPPSLAAMTAAEKITSTPFNGDESAFESDTVREEYEALCRDHSSLINFGSSYATFDPMGKIAYLDEIEKIEERWEVFFARFKLLGQLNQDFVRQCDAFLMSMGMTEDDFRVLLKKTHEIMREDAQRERGLVA